MSASAKSLRPLQAFTQWEQLNFLLTNRIPRHAATALMGKISRIQSRPLTRAMMAVWRQFDRDFALEEAANQDFASLEACFTRKLKPGLRPQDPRSHIATSPCDAIVGAHGRLADLAAWQVKGYPYSLEELIPDPNIRQPLRDGIFVTLRLKSSFYHRFHAPFTGSTQTLDYIAGDCWNVNPATLKRVPRLFCQNERAVIPFLPHDAPGMLCLVPVAAILVASMGFSHLPEVLEQGYQGPSRLSWAHPFNKGDEMGYFRQGSTILLFASHPWELCSHLQEGQRICVGAPLLQLPPTTLTP